MTSSTVEALKPRGPLEHELKTWPHAYDAVEDGLKPWEYRKADRDYRAGDTLWLRKWSPTEGYWGDSIRRAVTFVLAGGAFGIPDDYCIMSLAPHQIEAQGSEPGGARWRPRAELLAMLDGLLATYMKGERLPDVVDMSALSEAAECIRALTRPDPSLESRETVVEAVVAFEGAVEETMPPRNELRQPVSLYDQLQTEREMHAAWRKRAEEAEAALSPPSLGSEPNARSLIVTFNDSGEVVSVDHKMGPDAWLKARRGIEAAYAELGRMLSKQDQCPAKPPSLGMEGVRESLEEARDLLAERIHGNPARSAGHNARLVIERVIASLPSAT